MKKSHKLYLSALMLLGITSCADDSPLFYEVEKPERVAKQELIDAYAPLKSYINRSNNPNFKLGAAVDVGSFNSKGVLYRLVKDNFDELTLGYGMKHGAIVQDDGSMNFERVSELMLNASSGNVSIYGHTLCWHANQNATYLNSTIAPDLIPGDGPAWNSFVEIDFENDDASKYQGNAGAAISFTADGEGFDGAGRAMVVTNSGGHANDWDCQLFFILNPKAQEGEQYELTMNVKSAAPFSIPTQAHGVPTAYQHWDFFGSIQTSSEWTTYTRQITVSAEQAGANGAGAIALNLGVDANVFYFDNVVVKKYDEEGGAQTVEKTPQAKKEIITQELDRWITQMMELTKDHVKAWDVVNEPMDDGKPYELKTGEGKNLSPDEFYWQDYMGKDYAVEAFKMAEKYGNNDDKLFINDYNLEYNLDKCKGLIAYAAYIESKGARVDGIGTQMHITTDSDKDKIVQMLELLAETGKLIKISELDIGVGVKTNEASEEDLQAQAEMYRFVIEKYFEIIPASQRYGITIWSPLDSPASSSWRAGEPIGLWTESYTRKPAYSATADGFSKN